jgi:hypothetical protein
MYFILIPLLFLCVTPDLNEPLCLARSFVLISWVLLFIIFKPKMLKLKSKWQLSLLSIPFLYILSAIVNEQNPILALVGNYNRNFGILTLLAVAIIVIYLSNENIETKKFLIVGILPITAMSIIYSFMQSNNIDPITWGETNRTVLTLGNSDYAAALLGVLIIAPLYGFLQSNSKPFKILMIISFALILRSGFNSRAVQFYVLSLLSLVIFILIYFWPKIQEISIKLRVAITITLVICISYYLFNNISDLIVATNAADRIAQQSEGLKMFVDHPFLGVGVDQHWRFVPMYFHSSDIQRLGSNLVPDKTHNLIVDHLAMGGLFVGLAFTIFLFYSLVLTYRLNTLGAELKERKEVALLSGIWVTYVIHLFISTDNIFMMALGYLSFGLISQIYYQTFPSVNKLNSNNTKFKVFVPTIIRMSASITLIVSFLVNINGIAADAKVKKILQNKILNGAEIIKTLDSYPNPKSAEAVIAFLVTNPNNCGIAVEASDKLLALDNRSSQAWYFKGLCSDVNGNQRESLEFIKKALKLFPLNLNYLDAKFRLEVNQKEFDAARATLAKIQSIDSGYEAISNLEDLLNSNPGGS